MDAGKGINLVVITGMSGAGKTVAVQSLEDLGFFCIDNLPPILLPKFVELLERSKGKLRKAALVIDLRGREFFSSLFESLDTLEKHRIHYQILFLEASDQALVRRYKETRRRHPLSRDGTPLDGILQERKLLEEIKGRAHHIIDTSHLKPSQLKEKIAARFGRSEQEQMTVTFLSFGYVMSSYFVQVGVAHLLLLNPRRCGKPSEHPGGRPTRKIDFGIETFRRKRGRFLVMPPPVICARPFTPPV